MKIDVNNPAFGVVIDDNDFNNNDIVNIENQQIILGDVENQCNSEFQKP